MKTKVLLHGIYLTRNGCLAIIVSVTLADGLHSVVAWVIENGLPCIRYYTPYGFEHQPIGNEQQQEQPYDLVELFGKPPVEAP